MYLSANLMTRDYTEDTLVVSLIKAVITDYVTGSPRLVLIGPIYRLH
jgi:hypothetical protein